MHQRTNTVGFDEKKIKLWVKIRANNKTSYLNLVSHDCERAEHGERVVHHNRLPLWQTRPEQHDRVGEKVTTAQAAPNKNFLKSNYNVTISKRMPVLQADIVRLRRAKNRVACQLAVEHDSEKRQQKDDRRVHCRRHAFNSLDALHKR